MAKAKVITLKTCVADITSMWVRSAASFIRIGRKLLEFEATLSLADFAALIGRHGEQGKVPFSYSVARKLMAIGEDKRLSRLLAHGPKRLPPCWRTLYEITLLTDEQYKCAIKQGLIHSGMERNEVERLRGLREAEPPPPEEPRGKILYLPTSHKTEQVPVYYVHKRSDSTADQSVLVKFKYTTRELDDLDSAIAAVVRCGVPDIVHRAEWRRRIKAANQALSELRNGPTSQPARAKS